MQGSICNVSLILGKFTKFVNNAADRTLGSIECSSGTTIARALNKAHEIHHFQPIQLEYNNS